MKLLSELVFYTLHLFLQGVIKPDIVFFGENLPAKFFSFTIDMPQADLLIVMGTSLEVHIMIYLKNYYYRTVSTNGLLKYMEIQNVCHLVWTTL